MGIAATNGFQVMGVNSDCDTCSHCGRTNLRKVVWLAKDGCEAEPVGRDCAARLLGKSATSVWNAAVMADYQREREVREKVHLIGAFRSVRPFLVESVGAEGQTKLLAVANGSKLAIEKWAAEQWPNLITVVRVAR